MDLNSQNKVLKAGFMIIRKDDYPQPKIKYKQFGFPEWRTFEKFTTKAARDRRFKDLLYDSSIIED